MLNKKTDTLMVVTLCLRVCAHTRTHLLSLFRILSHVSLAVSRFLSVSLTPSLSIVHTLSRSVCALQVKTKCWSKKPQGMATKAGTM